MDNSQALVIAELSVGEYAVIRGEYRTMVQGSILEYLLTDKAKVTTFRNQMKRAIADYFGDAFWLGYTDGGGDANDPDPDDQAWVNAKQESEFGFCDQLFQQLKELKSAEGITGAEMEAEAARRADGYAKTLDGVYSEGKLRGSKDVMAQFGGTDGAESCPECQKYKGQKHKLSWWLRRGLIPGQPGNAAFTCRGYNCNHFLFNAKTGEILTI